MSANPEGFAAKLCYAPADRIPHPPHIWYEPDLAASRPDELVGWTPRYCDGWAAVLPDFLKGLSDG